MDRIADYGGTLLNHVETLYRPGERSLAVGLVEALGCSITDTGFMGEGTESFLAAHLNPADPDIRNNVLFMSPMGAEQQAVESRLESLAESDSAFAATIERYREGARTKPFGVPHFALRYRSAADVRRAADTVRARLGDLGERVHVRVFEVGESGASGAALLQGFVYQDVIVSGSFLYGQLIELQSQPS